LPNDFNIRCTSASIPTQQSILQTVNIRNFEVSYPVKSPSGGDISLTFIDDKSLKMINFFREWQDLQYSPIFGQTGNKKTDYTKGSLSAEALITLFLLDNKNDVILIYNLIGCLIKNLKYSELSNEAKTLQISVTLHYDYFTTTNTEIAGVAENMATYVSNAAAIGDIVKGFKF